MIVLSERQTGESITEFIHKLPLDIYKMSDDELERFINKVENSKNKYPNSYLYITIYQKNGLVHFMHGDQNKRKNSRYNKCLGGITFDLHITQKYFYNQFIVPSYDQNGKRTLMLKKDEAFNFILKKSLNFKKEYYESYLKYNNGNIVQSFVNGYTDPKDYKIQELKLMLIDFLPQKEWQSFRRFTKYFKETIICDDIFNDIIIPEFYQVLPFYQDSKMYDNKTRILYFLTMTYLIEDENSFSEIMKDVSFTHINKREIIDVNINKQHQNWNKYFVQKS